VVAVSLVCAAVYVAQAQGNKDIFVLFCRRAFSISPIFFIP
jgi:hypothetical protein